jgi:hypothetical protein
VNGRDATLRLGIVFVARYEHADVPYAPVLLRPRRQRPRRRRAAEEGEEGASFHDRPPGVDVRQHNTATGEMA